MTLANLNFDDYVFDDHWLTFNHVDTEREFNVRIDAITSYEISGPPRWLRFEVHGVVATIAAVRDAFNDNEWDELITELFHAIQGRPS
jgi:hypothetical protein